MFPKSYHTNGLQAKQILSVKIQNKYIFDLGRGFCDSFSMLFPEAPDSCGKKKMEIIFAALYFHLHELKKYVSDFKSYFRVELLIFLTFMVSLLVDLFN